jgi:hypothetical protein
MMYRIRVQRTSFELEMLLPAESRAEAIGVVMRTAILYDGPDQETKIISVHEQAADPLPILNPHP